MFVTCEGLDGAGKDTVLEAIEQEYPDAVITREPTELWTGKQVRKCLSDESTDPLMDFYMFMADRVNHVREIVEPADERGDLVVSGRYADSTRAYQPVMLANEEVFPSQNVAKLYIESVMGPWDYEPDLTIYLDISVDTALERCAEDEKYEKRQFLEPVQQNYEAMCEVEDRFVRVDAERPPDEVVSSVLAEIDRVQ